MSKGSEAYTPLVGKASVVGKESMNRTTPGKKKGKVPKRMHKSEREKRKREHLNELFLDLASALELSQQNSGKASVLCEASRLLKDLLGQIESLKKENESLLSESHYVSIEKNELREENSALENQIEKLQSELEARVAQSKPDLNEPPPELQQRELPSHLPGVCLGMPGVEPPLPQAPAVFVLPIGPDTQIYPFSDISQLTTSKPSSNLSKPHARYPTPADVWPSELLGQQPTTREELQFSGSNCNISNQ